MNPTSILSVSEARSPQLNKHRHLVKKKLEIRILSIPVARHKPISTVVNPV